MENRCVCCNKIVPEGRQVCPNCLNGSKERAYERITEPQKKYPTKELNRLRELENMLENGTLQYIPFKEGDAAYFDTYTDNGKTNLGVQPHKITGVRISALYAEKYGQTGNLPLTSLGKHWFLNKMEANKKLNKRSLKNEN